MVHYTNRGTSILSWSGKSYRPGAQIPESLAIAMGWASSSDKSVPDQDSAPDDVVPDDIDGIPDALQLINNSDDAALISSLPTIGAAGARLIFEARPDGGYESLEQVTDLSPQILIAPFKTDWNQVEAWVKTDD